MVKNTKQNTSWDARLAVRWLTAHICAHSIVASCLCFAGSNPGHKRRWLDYRLNDININCFAKIKSWWCRFDAQKVNQLIFFYFTYFTCHVKMHKNINLRKLIFSLVIRMFWILFVSLRNIENFQDACKNWCFTLKHSCFTNWCSSVVVAWRATPCKYGLFWTFKQC